MPTVMRNRIAHESTDCNRISTSRPRVSFSSVAMNASIVVCENGEREIPSRPDALAVTLWDISKTAIVIVHALEAKRLAIIALKIHFASIAGSISPKLLRSTSIPKNSSDTTDVSIIFAIGTMTEEDKP